MKNVIVFVLFSISFYCFAEEMNKYIREVLREPLPSEDLVCNEGGENIVIQGPTFRYVVERKTGVVTDVEVVREGAIAVKLLEPLALWIDDVNLVKNGKCETKVDVNDKNQVVLISEGTFKSDTSYRIKSIFYNDGVAVFQITLIPDSDWHLTQGIRYEIGAKGLFTHYLHKRRDTYGFDCYQGEIPKIGETARVFTPTSCLEVYSNKSALALFTDMGDYYRSPQELDTGAVRVDSIQGDDVSVNIHQHIIHVGEKGEPYVLKTGEPFTFRIGLAVAPNRLPHPRRHDLRMFIWIGDEKYPYPTDEEIWTVARLGFTLFQMHRLGPPGEPRPPAGELDRVIKTVHDAGMLFIWTANADLMYAHDTEISKRIKEGRWVEWEGYNYGGRYKASMDSFCDLMATCLASPNGLADYRMECNKKMMERYPVDGMYIDDNLAYPNCKRWKEHNHPQKVYDCLIELHDVNWRRRVTLKEKIPHVVLIEHCSKAFVLPVIAPFDMHLFGEGYDFTSVEEFRATFGSFSNMYGHGCLYIGDDETQRCPSASAYTFDLLTGGGQYCTVDWRIWSKKFPYAAGVQPEEINHINTYNLMQYYLGMYETDPLIELKTNIAETYAVLYHNRVSDDCLLIIANKTDTQQNCSVTGYEQTLTKQLTNKSHIAIYDTLSSDVNILHKDEWVGFLKNILVSPSQMKAFYFRAVSLDEPYHIFGGKRISEKWDKDKNIFSVTLDAPAGLEDKVVIGTGNYNVKKVTVNDNDVNFTSDPTKKIVLPKVVYSSKPILVELHAL
ncbi:MAG TPA: hypothetical protein PLA12_11950 [Candidatus Hydrogenedens sp.]|nr:hypothetical protein [Candidatus Hydrogenedens sp.]